MNANEIEVVKHALKNNNRYYTESNDPTWNGLVEKGFAEERGGWEEGMSYFTVTSEGRAVLNQPMVVN